MTVKTVVIDRSEPEPRKEYPKHPDCPNCLDGGRVGPSHVGLTWYCYECCGTFD